MFSKFWWCYLCKLSFLFLQVIVAIFASCWVGWHRWYQFACLQSFRLHILQCKSKPKKLANLWRQCGLEFVFWKIPRWCLDYLPFHCASIYVSSMYVRILIDIPRFFTYRQLFYTIYWMTLSISNDIWKLSNCCFYVLAWMLNNCVYER